MFACIYSRTVPKSQPKATIEAAETGSSLVDLAFTFSPLVEQTAADTVVLDISGQDFLFGVSSATPSSYEVESARRLATEIIRRSKDVGLKVNVAVAANVDAAIHAARSLKEITVIPPGEELATLGSLSIKKLDYSLAAIEEKRAGEIQETFALWGVRTFSDLARLPLPGLAERLGQDGVRMQKLAQGRSERRLKLVRPPIGFEQSLELEHAISEVEPLSFILLRLLNQLCANLHEYALATNQLNVNLKLQNNTRHERAISLPVPMRNPKTLLRLALFDVEREPPQAPIIAVRISADPVEPRASQNGLFIPLAPEPEKLEITLARLAKLVGAENVGSPEILDTHRPDAFRMKKFALDLNHRGHRGRNPKVGISDVVRNRQSAMGGNRRCIMGFRIFRPAWRADVKSRHGKPARLNACSEQTSGRVRGEIVCAAGPWRASGDWWRTDVWARDEWDVAVIDRSSPDDTETLCRIYRDLTTEQWFVAGIYD